MANSLVDARKLGVLSRMELVARHAVEGFISGRHPSPYHGSSVEYADHRPYTMGDEIRTLDWKLLAKTDKYYVKLFEEETNCRVTILLDASKSMGFGGVMSARDVSKQAAKEIDNANLTGPMRVSKYEYGCYLAAALSYLMLGQNDAVGLMMFDSAVRHYLPPRTTPSHFRRMLELMLENTADRDTSLGPVLHEAASRLKRRGLVVVISDMIDDPEKIVDGLGHFRFNRHEVIVFHLMDPIELTFPYDRFSRFKDIEGAGSLIANPRSVREKYLERMEKFLKEIRGKCLEHDISYQFVQTDTPYEKMLMAYLEKRQKMK